MIKRALLLTGLLVALAACSGDGEADGATPQTAKGEAPGTSFAASADRATGNVKLALPGAKLDLDLPGGLLDSSDFDIDGMKLYPGSVVDNLDIKARENAAGEADDEATINIAFTAPAAPDRVRAWFLSQTANAKRPLRAAGDTLVGSTDEGKAMTMSFVPMQDGRTRGRVRIDG